MTVSVNTIGKTVAIAIATVLAAVNPTAAQLLSPGELSLAHAELEGVTNCTSCHTIGGKGVDETKCLDCHNPIRSRIEANTGFHSTISDPCVTCHKDHLGRNFNVVRFDTTSFDHLQAGYELLGTHSKTACSNCHRPDLIADADVLENLDGSSTARTFLGLDTSCRSCHQSDNPHENQFESKACSDCHTPEKWTQVDNFDHGATEFPLTGRHTDVTCNRCHPNSGAPDGQVQIQFSGLTYSSCSGCHADPHKSSFGTVCTSCHTTQGWSQLASERAFSHDQTGYRLLGAHARTSCMNCHRRPARNDRTIQIAFKDTRSTRAYPKIEVGTCLSCHVRYHGDSFRAEISETSCDACHTDERWIPATYDIDRHNDESRFALTGAHLSVPCIACHVKEATKAGFHFEERRCDTCHDDNNPHGAQFNSRMVENSCGSCHSTDSWNTDVDFDHSSTGFALVGKHTYLECSGCHVPKGEISAVRGLDYSGLARACGTCHRSVDPHGDQFQAKDCAACHDQTGFQPVSPRFDHSETRFRLEGAHSRTACNKCHETVLAPDGARFTRYVIEKTQCVDCHLSE